MPSIQNVDAALALIKTDKSKILNLSVGKHTSIEPGQKIPKADAQQSPSLSFTNTTPGTTYLVIALDIDAPYPSFGILGPILHWIQPGFTAATDGTLTAAGVPFVADYIGPAPPPPSAPHRYVFMLFEQPAGFDGAKYAPADGKKLGNMGRIRWDLEAFRGKTGLGEILAINYFVSN